MLKDSPPAPIRLLPRQLADQIAAGEVIERPASVLKELIENALDAGSTRLDIELQTGGMELIRVTDNGYGIPADELPLAISRHATSKISALDDLLSLHSLGFRGEALASICSVSQWEISSRTDGQDSAFRLSEQWPDTLLESNHARGTTVSIRDLFRNTPARRKFLRTERTELRYCDDVIRRMALARFDVAFYVRHNGRFVHRLPAVSDDIGRTRRVARLCGEAFIRHALAIDFSHPGLRLHGWISNPQYSRQQTDLQYFYINGRIIRDRVISHAIRLAYQANLPTGRHAAFVLNLELDPAQVDVNVHPTKHEVRFREARQIHDFISRSLKQALQPDRCATLPADAGSWPLAETEAVYTGVQEAAQAQVQSGTLSHFGEMLALLCQRYVLTQHGEALFLIDAQRFCNERSCRDWQSAMLAGEVRTQPLLIPQVVKASAAQQQAYERNAALLTQAGFDITRSGPTTLLLRAIPVQLRGVDAQALLPILLTADLRADTLLQHAREAMSQQRLNLHDIGLAALLVALARVPQEYADCWRQITGDDLATLLHVRPVE